MMISMSRHKALLMLVVFACMPCLTVPAAGASALATAADYAGQGDSYRQEGQLFQAVNAYRKAVANGLDHRDLYRNLSITLSDLWLVDEAIIEMEKAVALAQDDALLHVELGILYLVKDRFASAEKELALALAIDPAYGDAYYYLGEVFFRSGRDRLAWYAAKTAQKLGHHGRTLLEKLQRKDAEPAQYPWDAEISSMVFRQAVVKAQADAEAFLIRYRRGELFSDMISEWGVEASPSGFVGFFTPEELQPQIAAAVLGKKPYAEPVIVETESGYHIVQRILPFDLALWKNIAGAENAVRQRPLKPSGQPDLAGLPLCVEDQYIDLRKNRIYTGAYIDQKTVSGAVEQLRADGFPAFCWPTTGKDGLLLYNAVAGQFDSFAEAESVLGQLTEKGYSGAFIKGGNGEIVYQSGNAKANVLPSSQEEAQSSMEKRPGEVTQCVDDQYIETRKFRIYTGVYGVEENAVRAVKKLQAEGFSSFCLAMSGEGQQFPFSAIVGQFDSFSESESVLSQLTEKGYSGAFITGGY